MSTRSMNADGGGPLIKAGYEIRGTSDVMRNVTKLVVREGIEGWLSFETVEPREDRRVDS